MKKVVSIILLVMISSLAIAGGNPEFVKYPANYKADFINYDTRNRGNGKQVASLYINQAAMDSINATDLDIGSKVVMEVYKPKLDTDGAPLTDLNGQFIKDKLAAVAVMEKRTDWPADFSANDRAGDWGFAIYNTDGTPKDNSLECAACHQPLQSQDYRFSFDSLTEFINNHK